MISHGPTQKNFMAFIESHDHFSVSVWFESVIAGEEKNKYGESLYFFPHFFGKKVRLTVLAQALSAASIQICLYQPLVSTSILRLGCSKRRCSDSAGTGYQRVSISG